MADHVLCVRPSCFGYNEDTAATNSFQYKPDDETLVNDAAVREFDVMMCQLRAYGISVIEVQDDSAKGGIRTPDSIFPNNWFSTHRCGINYLYPMCGVNRREERKGGVLDVLRKAKKTDWIDATKSEIENKFLEGTGSLVLDHENKVCYAAISPRTDSDLVDAWCTKLGYQPIKFKAYRTLNDELVYHTNVLMSVGSQWIVCCLEMIKDSKERETVLRAIRSSGKSIIEISEDQVNQFCGNILSVKSDLFGGRVTVMSSTAAKGFTLQDLQLLGPVCIVCIPTIERIGGGSARCMLAEIFETD